ncbi:MAG: LysR family transcriptional regulator [Myxococcaceae bacterium]|nr:LysR family transcriptional regulator [Myxococcaceae bacterium]
MTIRHIGFSDIVGGMTPLDEVNFHHLLCFSVVAREGSVSRGAEVLGLAQPTVSGKLRALEEDLGERLFRRRGRGVELTETGHLVRRYAEDIYALGEELMDAVHGRPSSGPVRFAVGVSDSLPKLTTWKLLEPAFAGPVPLRPVVRVGKTDQLLTDLSTHALDLVLADQPIAPGGTVRAFNHLLGETGVTVFAIESLADRFRRGFPRSLDGAPFVLPTTNTALRRSIDSWFDSRGFRPIITAEVEDLALLQLLGSKGIGLFAAPSVVEHSIRQQYQVRVVGRLEDVRERFYAISIDKKLKHPAVVALSQAARTRLFAE